jgi:hypothetical protein
LIPTSTSKRAEAQVAEDLDALDGVDVGVHVAHAHAHLLQVVGEVLGHALGQRRDQDPLARLLPLADLGQQVVDLTLHGPDLDLRVHQPGRADQLLHHHAPALLVSS